MVAARVIVVKIEHINIDVLDKLIEEERNEVIGFLRGHCLGWLVDEYSITHRARLGGFSGQFA